MKKFYSQMAMLCIVIFISQMAISQTPKNDTILKATNYLKANTIKTTSEGVSSPLTIGTTSQYVKVGPQNSSFSHFTTSLPAYYFDKEVRVNTGYIGSYDENLYLRAAGSTKLTLQTDGKAKFIGEIYLPYEKRLVLGPDWNNSMLMFTNGSYRAAFIDHNIGSLFIRNGTSNHIIIQNNGALAVSYPIDYSNINKDYASGYQLAVNGKILCEGIEGVSNVPNSDFVFEEDYGLLSIEELDNYIKENKHLPEVQSAENFAKNGYNMNEFDDLLLRKIEELTLYIIEQNKKIETLEQKLVEISK